MTQLHYADGHPTRHEGVRPAHSLAGFSGRRTSTNFGHQSRRTTRAASRVRLAILLSSSEDVSASRSMTRRTRLPLGARAGARCTAPAPEAKRSPSLTTPLASGHPLPLIRTTSPTRERKSEPRRERTRALCAATGSIFRGSG